MKRLFYIICLMLFLTSCDPWFLVGDYVLWIENKGDSKVCFLLNYDYPDTLLPQSKKHVQTLSTGRRTHLVCSKQEWKDSFSEHFPSDTLHIFFFDPDTINAYDWETIVSDYKVMESRVYSRQDLEDCGWNTITYP